MQQHNESAQHDRNGDESREASTTRDYEPRPRRPTPFPHSETAIPQADGDA
jgi:hypothetical protein